MDMAEDQLDTHHVAIMMPPAPAQDSTASSKKRFLRFLLLSANSTTDPNFAATLLQIQHFASLTGGADIAIIMLLHPAPAIVSARSMAKSHDSSPHISNISGVQAYVRLEVELFNLTDLPHIPILPLAKVEGLRHLLISHAQGMSRPVRESARQVTAGELLEYCTLDPPLSPLAVNLVTDVFSSLAELAAEATAIRRGDASTSLSSELNALQSSDGGSLDDLVCPGLAELKAQLDPDVVKAMVEFWEEEWAAK